MRISYERQEGIANPEQFRDLTVELIGCGGIGSWAGLTLAKLGVRAFSLHDGDEVEAHNLPNQAFDQPKRSISKVDALKQRIRAINKDTTVLAYHEFCEPDSPIGLSNLVIMGVDSLETRARLWGTAISSSREWTHYIDGRLGGEACELYTIRQGDQQAYSSYLPTLKIPKEEQYEAPCTAGSAVHSSGGIGMLIGSTLRRILTDEFDWERDFQQYFDFRLWKSLPAYVEYGG